MAVVAVLINHLDPGWLPGGYLGVDLFFVISGAVVTGSLLGRPSRGAVPLLLEFYRRRFRRLLPALIVNVLVVALLFAALVNPGDTLMPPSLRTGMAALFGVANLYLLRQGSNYFGTDNHYNPFLHTWSLGVEEQFYLIWPLLLLLCGLGWRSTAAVRQRLGLLSLLLSLASLAFVAWLQLRGQNAASFYLMPARFWELAAGALAWRVYSVRPRPTRPGGAGRRWSGLVLLALLLALLLTPESWRLPATLTCVAVSAALLILLDAEAGPGRWLALPLPLAVGLSSYSLYLWHWPVIVLARWSVGINRVTLLPLLALIAGLTWLSYRLECRFRQAGGSGAAGQRRVLVVYPLLAVASACLLALLGGPARGGLFLGDRRHLALDTANGRAIPGTTVDTARCFLDPTAPLAAAPVDALCRVQRHPGRPTLFFEGDSHTMVLIPLGQALLERGGLNVAFVSRGGCPVPWFSPWPQDRDRSERYQLCRAASQLRLSTRLQTLQPGDQLVLSSNLPGYLLDDDPARQRLSQASYAAAVRDLAGQLRRRGAGLILFGPLPSFPARASLAVPASLCQPEWFRTPGLAAQSCSASLRPRPEQLAQLASLNRLLTDLEQQLPNLRVFRPFAALCPEGQPRCSSHRGDTLLFMDSNHLSREGVRLLEEPFLRFLRDAGLRQR